MKKKYTFTLIIFIIGIFIFLCLFPTPVKKSELDIEQAKKIAEYKKLMNAVEEEKKVLDTWLDQNTPYPAIPSAAIILVYNGKILHKKTVRTTVNTPFMIASLTKTFVALSILQLADKGLLSLDDPVRNYLHVDFENKDLDSVPITIRHLLTHTSGLIEKESTRNTGMDVPFSVPEQHYPTGYRFSYCNQGYNLLGYVIFEVTGMNLGEYITKNILIPMEMNDSRAPENTRGAVGVSCSINDLGNYIIMLLGKGSFKNKQIISKKMFNEIYKESVIMPPARYKEYRGICWRIWKIDNEVYSLSHAAHMNGVGGWMQIYPQYNVGYVFLSNPPIYDRQEFYTFYSFMKAHLYKFAGILIGDGYKPENFSVTRPSTNELNWFVGKYKNLKSGSYINIIHHTDGYLVAIKSDSNFHYAIHPNNMQTFVYVYPGQFEKGELFDFIWKDGKIVGLGAKGGYYTRIPNDSEN